MVWIDRFKGVRISVLAAGMVVILSGCHRMYSEHLVRSGITGPDAPEWVQGNPQDPMRPDQVFFVGRSVGYNVVDESAAVAAAREDVYRQIASLISTRVDYQSYAKDSRHGGETGFDKPNIWDNQQFRTLPGNELQQQIWREAWLFSSAVTGDLIDQGVYFEQWDIRDADESLENADLEKDCQEVGVYPNCEPGMIRYKCWVLMSIPREKLEQQIQQFKMYVVDAYDRYQKDRVLTYQWAQQDRELRQLREAQDREWMREDQRANLEEAKELRRILCVDRVRFSCESN